MSLEVLFGAAYYLEYMPYDRLEEDIKMMKAAGMNVVRIAESTCSTLEPKDGIFNFTYIDRVLEIVEKEGMKAIIGIPTYAIFNEPFLAKIISISLCQCPGKFIFLDIEQKTGQSFK